MKCPQTEIRNINQQPWKPNTINSSVVAWRKLVNQFFSSSFKTSHIQIPIKYEYMIYRTSPPGSSKSELKMLRSRRMEWPEQTTTSRCQLSTGGNGPIAIVHPNMNFKATVSSDQQLVNWCNDLHLDHNDSEPATGEMPTLKTTQVIVCDRDRCELNRLLLMDSTSYDDRKSAQQLKCLYHLASQVLTAGGFIYLLK